MKHMRSMKYIVSMVAQCVFAATALQGSQILPVDKIACAKAAVRLNLENLKKAKLFFDREAKLLREASGLDSVDRLQENGKQVREILRQIDDMEGFLFALDFGTYDVTKFSCHHDVSDLD